MAVAIKYTVRNKSCILASDWLFIVFVIHLTANQLFVLLLIYSAEKKHSKKVQQQFVFPMLDSDWLLNFFSHI